MKNDMTIQKNIIKLFEMNKDKKPAQLATLLETRQSTIDGWTKQGKCPAASVIPIIADFFDVSINTLYGIDDKATISTREQTLLNEYRRQPEMQEAVDRLLGIQKTDEVTAIGHLAAFGGSTKRVEYTEKEVIESDKARDQFHYESMSSFDDEE